jgi:DNA-binding NtrC family response regulator
MRNDITDLKKLTQELIKDKKGQEQEQDTQFLIDKIYGKESEDTGNTLEIISNPNQKTFQEEAKINTYDDAETVEETISLQEKEFEMIKHALERNKGKRKLAAKELGISERTLYRKIKEYDLK